MKYNKKEETIMLKGFKKGFGFGIGWLVGQAAFIMFLDETLNVLKARVNKEEPEETKDVEEPDKAEE